MSLYQNIKYLKHSGKMINVKVSIEIVDNNLMIYIRDLAFTDYKKALEYLRYISDTECVTTSYEEKHNG